MLELTNKIQEGPQWAVGQSHEMNVHLRKHYSIQHPELNQQFQLDFTWKVDVLMERRIKRCIT